MEEGKSVQDALARLRALAGPEGVDVHPHFGWFGFLDAIPGPVTESDVLQGTPSTSLSEPMSEEHSRVPLRRKRGLYRHPNFQRENRRREPHCRVEDVSGGDQRRMRMLLKKCVRRYGRGQVREWVRRLIDTLA
jgi:hypothetical protein